MKKFLCLITLIVWGHGGVFADPEQTYYSPMVDKNLLTTVLWGDTHLHSSYSLDANLFMENTKLGPDDAYRFAKGEPIQIGDGRYAQLNRPLDFLMVADHAQFLGVYSKLRSGDPELLKIDYFSRWFQLLQEGVEGAFRVVAEANVTDMRARMQNDTVDVRRSAWDDIIAMADEAYHPGRFTTFGGFEWTPMPDGNNLHRVVMFRDGADKTTRIMPFSALDGEDPEDLWRYMENYEQTTGGKVLAIPHNSNLSAGLMFGNLTAFGEPMTKSYVQARRRWEPVVEVTQTKGDSETHPMLSPNDEFAVFGRWDRSNLLRDVEKDIAMLSNEYVRSGLRQGLSIAQKLGSNPYQFGMIGSTDSHTSLSTTEEDNFWGKSPDSYPSSDRASKPYSLEHENLPTTSVMEWEQLASGSAAVWATANTREAIFDAMKRREVYATTGPRMTVRFFGGWDFEAGDVARPDYALIGYDKGVPMGGELPPGFKRTTAPRFMITALKDPQGANLDRVQVIKGWLDADGKTHEQVYDVAWSGDRQPATDGRLPAVGSTVDLKNATWQNTIGAVQLSTVWTDPDFDPDQRAFYYVRVLEIPTPRWVVYDQVRLGAELPADAERVHQERAYTSPIWYEPVVDN